MFSLSFVYGVDRLCPLAVPTLSLLVVQLLTTGAGPGENAHKKS